MQQDYITISEFADIRGVSKSTIKRRIDDKIIKKIKTMPGPFKGQRQYMIHRSELSIRQRDLFGPKRAPQDKEDDPLATQSLLDNDELITNISYLRRTIDIASKRLEAIEIALSKPNK